jgi:hypothetical protein
VITAALAALVLLLALAVVALIVAGAARSP